MSLRDTDSDWRKIGAEQPFWGVLSGEQYRTENLTDDALAEFYASGHADIAAVVERTARLLGAWPAPVRALDFGCGVGRLVFAMARHAQEVVGYDISPEMLREAHDNQARAQAPVSFTNDWPAGPPHAPGFDWINSYIVFQHIPPERGLAILQDLMGLLNPGGLVSLHFTLYRDEALKPPVRSAARDVAGRFLGRQAEPPPGSVSMYDYDLGAIFEILTRAGIEQTALAHTNHAGHHGAQIVGRRG